MNLLVTGCFGFIGFNFINNLLKEKGDDFNIIGIDSLESSCSAYNKESLSNTKNFTYYKTNINEIKDHNIQNVDLIINFAAESHVDNSIYNPGVFIDSNVKGVINMLRFAYDLEVENFIHVSTDEVYGSSEKNFNIETDPFNPSSTYSASKASAELIINSFEKTFGYKTKIVRPANNYGIFQQPEKLIPYSIANLETGKNLEIYGEGKNIRHWLHVDDTFSAILHVAQNGDPGEIYNIGSEFYLSNIEVANKILSHFGLNENRLDFVEDRPGHDFRYAVNIDKLKELGWKPTKYFDIEIEKTIDWYLENKEWWFSEYQNIINNKRTKRMGVK